MSRDLDFLCFASPRPDEKSGHPSPFAEPKGEGPGSLD